MSRNEGCKHCFPPQEMRLHCSKTSEKRVAVLACGPSAMIEDARKQCMTQSREGVTFDFHSETFEF